MSSGVPDFGSGGFFGGGANPGGGQGPSIFGPGIPDMGTMTRQMGPRGPFGCWPSCGCSGCLIIAAGILLVFGGLLRMLGQ